jgi:hypothetical protein
MLESVTANVNKIVNTEFHLNLWLNNSTNSIESSVSLEVHSRTASQKIPRLYGTRHFITVFRRTHHWSLYLAVTNPVLPVW